METRLSKGRAMRCFILPRSSYHPTHSTFDRHEVDVWTEIAKHLDGISLVKLAATCKWFNHVMMEDAVWKYACLRDLEVPDPGKVAFKWIQLYASAFDGSRTYMIRQKERYIGWLRIGAFVIDSDKALLTQSLVAPLRIPKEETIEKMLALKGCCVLNGMKTGIWIADWQLVRCPVCNLDTCVGTVQTLESRHIELFLSEGYHDGSWVYETLGSHVIKKQAEGVSGGIFDIKHLNDKSHTDIFELKSWVGERNDLQPKFVIAFHAVAINTHRDLQDNEDVFINYQAMRAGKDGEVVSIRISRR